VEILVCVKRVPMVGGRIVVTGDGQDVDTRMSGFTVSPHEECAVEEAVRLTERFGGGVTVLTLGPPAAADQLRAMLALGASRAVLLETDGREWGPMATAEAIVAAIRGAGTGEGAAPADGAGTGGGAAPAQGAAGCPYDLLLFGNESADTAGYQVGVRVAHALGLPCVTGIKGLEVSPDGGPAPAGGGTARARREYLGAEEVFEIPLPAVAGVKEGINLPRCPSLPGRLRAKRAAIERIVPDWHPEGHRKAALRVPEGERRRAQILGHGTDAVPALVALLDDLGVLK
jgi:electron transfer flavoprotein beta subunit